ncbi:hypothetical protein V1515DRAFT_589347 [Lipomyces mesembrius]
MALALSIVCMLTELASLSVLQRADGIYAFVVVYNAIFGATWVFPLRARQEEWYWRLSLTDGSTLRLNANVTLEEIAIQFGDPAFEHEDQLDCKRLQICDPGRKSRARSRFDNLFAI